MTAQLPASVTCSPPMNDYSNTIKNVNNIINKQYSQNAKIEVFAIKLDCVIFDYYTHLMDLNVDNIRNISKLVQHEFDCAAFKVLISADSIRESVYGREKFPTGVIVKPFRLYNPAVRSNSRNHTTQDSRPPKQARRFTPSSIANINTKHLIYITLSNIAIITHYNNTTQHHKYLTIYNMGLQQFNQLH